MMSLGNLNMCVPGRGSEARPILIDVLAVQPPGKLSELLRPNIHKCILLFCCSLSPFCLK